MASNPIRFRQYSTGGSLPVTFNLWREGSNVRTENTNTLARKVHDFPTVAAAKAALANPAIICK